MHVVFVHVEHGIDHRQIQILAVASLGAMIERI